MVQTPELLARLYLRGGSPTLFAGSSILLLFQQLGKAAVGKEMQELLAWADH